jgi:archaellum component FlaC
LAQDNGIELTEAELEEMANTISGMNVNNIDQVTDKFNTFAETISTKADTAIDNLDASIDELRSDMAAMQFNENEITEMEKSAEKAADATQELSNSMSNIGGLAGEGVQGTFKMSVALTEFASTAMAVSSLITSVQSSMRIFADEGASGFEKFGAALSMIMPLLSTYNALQALSTTLTKADGVAKLFALVGYKMMKTEAGALTLAKIGETGAVTANTAAWYANPIMWIALIVVGVVAALAALVAVIGAVSKALSDAYNADAIAAENAEKAAENLTAAYEDAKTAYEDMIGAMDEYKSAREGLESLTKGTFEYEEAL